MIWCDAHQSAIVGSNPTMRHRAQAKAREADAGDLHDWAAARYNPSKKRVALP